MSERIAAELFEPVPADPAEAEAIARPSVSFAREAVGRLLRDRVAVVCALVLALLIALSFAAPELSPFEIREQHYGHTDAPLWTVCDDAESAGAGHVHIFGTDSLGRDLFARCWAGGRVSLIIALATALIDLVVGMLYGGAAAYIGGALDDVMMRAVEVVSGIPYLLIVILLMMVMPKGMWSIIAAYSIVGWIPMARLVRGQVLSLKRREFIIAVEALGAGPLRVIVRHLLPNTASVAIVRVTLSIPGAIFAEAWLSYLGLGVQLPQCSWGTLAQEGIRAFRLYPTQLLIPAACISLTMLAFNLFGDALRDALDPRARR